MRIFKPSFKDRKTGEKRLCDKWYVDFLDHHGIRRRIPAFTDKGQSKTLGDKIEKMVVCKQNSEEPSTNKELAPWLRGLPKRLQAAFVKFGLLDVRRSAAGTNLQQHLDDFRRALSVDSTAAHVKITCARVERVIAGCRFGFLGDIVGSEVKTFLAGNTPSDTSYNYYLKAFQHFCKWAVEDGRAINNPVAYIKKISVPKVEDKRPLTVDEVDRLLAATEKAEFRFGMSGHDRAVLYLLAVETGYRVRELRHLKVSSFDFENCTVSQEAKYCKNRQLAIQILKAERAKQFERYFEGRDKDDKAFAVPANNRTASMLRADLRLANIAPCDDAGRKVVFHSFRHTLATELDKAKATIKEQTTVMRHSDRGNLSQGTYTHVRTFDLHQAIENLPNHDWPGTADSKGKAVA